MVLMNLFAWQEWRQHIQMYECQGWREGGRGMNWEVGIDIHTLLCIK